MTTRTPLPFGSWPSPVSAADIARDELSLSWPASVVHAGAREVWWVEGRPESEGRNALVRRDVDGGFHDVLAGDWNPRSRIHEYGSRPWVRIARPTPTTSAAPEWSTVFCNWDDQRLYAFDDGSAAPRPLTTAGIDGVEHRYGEPGRGPGDTVIAVRETHRDGVIRRAIVAIPLDGSAADDDTAVTELIDGHDFFGFPTLSPDSRRLAYIAWNHPNMPWDTTTVCVAEVDDGRVTGASRPLAGGDKESVLQPEWADDHRLYLVSDRSGWWNLYRVDVDRGGPEPLCLREEEFAGPLWLLGFTSYGVLDDGRLAVTHGRGQSRLSLLDPGTGDLDSLELPLEFDTELHVDGDHLVGVAGAGDLPWSVVDVDISSRQFEVVRSATSDLPPADYLPIPVVETFRGPTGREVHAVVYPPRNPGAVGLTGERAPYLAFVHGGPTAHTVPELSLEKAYFTSRGIGIIDVNYGGSTGYGREYRERLREQWGVIDVEDTVAAIRALADRGDADPDRLGIRGGSAGGWTTLAALVFSDAFAAGAAYYPVTDLVPFAEDTHDFESRYLDGLVGPLPAELERYRERSPLTHLDRMTTPVLLLQGADDKVVPPSQPKAVADALAAKGVPHAYLLFEGEQHGFRKASSIVVALESELSFFGQVFGFVPPGVPELHLER